MRGENIVIGYALGRRKSEVIGVRLHLDIEALESADRIIILLVSSELFARDTVCKFFTLQINNIHQNLH